MFSLIISESKVWTLFLAVPELVSLFRFLGQCPGLEIWILVNNIICGNVEIERVLQLCNPLGKLYLLIVIGTTLLFKKSACHILFTVYCKESVK